MYEPGEYEAVLSYNGTTTTATWLVRDYDEVRKTKNVLLFIGDGMTTNMITAARLIGHKSVNGRYQSTMAMDKFPVLGSQMTHSIDAFITDSANSATALYSGHKSSVNALNVYADSSPDLFDDPKVETWAEMFYRIHGGKVGIVSTAYIADATPGAMTAHTRERGEYGAVIDSYVHGIVNYTWTEWPGVDVLFGGGAENFCPSEFGGETYMDLDYYNVFTDAGYTLVSNATELDAAGNDDKILGIFSISNLAKWLDRNVFTDNLEGNEDAPDCQGGDASDQPGLKEMTLKAIDVLQTRSEANDNSGWILMSEAANVDKQMHILDYDRALGDLLELDDTVKASIEHLKEIGELENTLVIVTADHGHGFDVFGNVDTEYLNAQDDDRSKRKAVGPYDRSGLSHYINTGDLSFGDSNFPSNWNPRYTLAQGLGANPDHREDYQVREDGPREPAANMTGFDEEDYFLNPEDGPNGFIVNGMFTSCTTIFSAPRLINDLGTLPVDYDQGVHSLTDVTVYAMGPCQANFGGVYNNIDVFFKISDCLGLSRLLPGGESPGGYGEDDGDNWGKYDGQGKYKYRRYGMQKPKYAGKGGNEKRHMKRGENGVIPKKYH